MMRPVLKISEDQMCFADSMGYTVLVSNGTFHSITNVNASLQCANIISSAAVCVTFQHV